MPTLNWLTRGEDIGAAKRVPYRLLEEVRELSSGAHDSGNMLIQGDNLEALKALLPFYAGRVKCIYIDPPYNTRSAFEHYDDNLEHTQWLAMMWPRLEMLRELLAEDGSIWVSIDDNEAHYLKVIMDEVFGRSNFIANVIWEKSDSPKMDSRIFSSRHDHVIVFARSIDSFSVNRILGQVPKHYDKTDESGRRYYLKPLRAMGSGEDTREARPSMYFPLTAPDGQSVYPKKPDGSDGRWRWGPEKVGKEQFRIEWVKGRSGWTAYYRIYADSDGGRPPETIFPHSVAGSNRTAKIQINQLFTEGVTFVTPKPENLVEHIFKIASNPGELILDSFLGSGTTAAVAHKMGRQYIGIEMGDHAVTHCTSRLRKVIEGENGGISKIVGWKGGGGFRFFRLGSPAFDELGCIQPEIEFDVLAAHIWFSETGTPWDGGRGSPFLGIRDGRAFALLYNGVLGDKNPRGGNVLTRTTLALIREAIAETAQGFNGLLTVYGEQARLARATLDRERIVFKQTPYDIEARA
ncbi:MAG: site-specific DNA-methyltransferase [Gammaproteobacteria bacterium]|nr:site-specific DNA-methyltransferase [Gammaproteobacteria bacterium]